MYRRERERDRERERERESSKEWIALKDPTEGRLQVRESLADFRTG